MPKLGVVTQAIAATLALSIAGCTAGYITNPNGNQWDPVGDDGSDIDTGVVTFSGSAGTYSVFVTGFGSGQTTFSFDPGASNKYTGPLLTNNSVEIPNGTYSIALQDHYRWTANNVQVSNGGVCPFNDHYTNDSTYCQLFNLKQLVCGATPQPPYQSGSFTVVEMAQHNSGQCGFAACSNNVTDYNHQYLYSPVITEVYWGCPSGAPTGCHVAPQTGLWPSLAGSMQFWARFAEYYSGLGKYGGSYSVTPPITRFVTDANIQTYLTQEIANGSVHSPYSYLSLTPSAMFVIYLPSTSCTSGDGQTCLSNVTAHHNYFYGSDGQLYVFAVMNGNLGANQDPTASHEVSEAATDPIAYGPGCGTNTGCGWNVAGQNQGEIGDLCSPLSEVIGGFNVAQIWSQNQCTCI